MFEKSPKYAELLDLYAQMAREGYDTRRGARVENAYSQQEAIKFRHELKPLFQAHSVSRVLDYGGGGGNWREKTVPEGGTLADFLGVEDYRVFEPARDIDDRQKTQAVVCFDVMEHIYVSDVGYVLSDLLSLAESLVVLNVATYKANALLPTGDNAHITCRPGHWWHGALEVLSAAYPEVTIMLYVSDAHARATRFEPINHSATLAAPGFER